MPAHILEPRLFTVVLEFPRGAETLNTCLNSQDVPDLELKILLPRSFNVLLMFAGIIIWVLK